MIHIADTKVARRYGDFFIRNIHKFDEVCIFCALVQFVVLQLWLLHFVFVILAK